MVKDICYSANIQTNSLGFHSKEYTIEKPKNIFRIVILGDSFVEAAQVPLEKTFFSLLEEKLNQTATGTLQYEVIPIAKSGHGTLKNTLFAREYAMRFKPDLIVESFITNDLEEDFFDVQSLYATEKDGKYDPLSLKVEDMSEQKKKILFIKHFFLERSILLERVWMNMLVLQTHVKKNRQPVFQTDEKQEKEILSQVLLQLNPELYKTVWDIESKSLATLSDFSKEKNTKFLLLHLTEGFLIEKELQKQWSVDAQKLENFPTSSIKDQLEIIAKKQGFAFFSTQEYFEQEYEKTHILPVWKCDNHYNAVGHEWVANAVFNFLLKNKKQFLNV